MANASSAPRREDQVFDRPLHLAGVLDNAADELSRTWFGYEWNDRTRCNCGIVARQVLQTTPARLKKILPPIIDEQGVFRPTWRAMTEPYCRDSGLTQHEVFSRLLEAGLRADDFSHLEELSHPEILHRMTPLRTAKTAVLRSRKTDVIAYLRTWALGIEEFRDRRDASLAEIKSESAPAGI
jgi:hypothetical protein